jgi:hypothetical protein
MAEREQALRLPQDDRLTVARRLLKSVETQATQAASDSNEELNSFSQRWRGKFVAADRNDDRYKALAQRHS